MEPVTVAKQIEKLIMAIALEGKRSKDLILAKAKSAVEYDKSLAISILTLKNDGAPTTIVEKQAKGQCTDQLLAKIVGEESLKAHWERLKYLQAQLNGFQSINRFLEHTQGVK